ncbi:MAG: protein translocase subunit SecD [Verrucomicrobiae bacterium]|nr:protein translocase subunit SecD [Verrucomicrobiae bacterium]
MKNPFFWLTAVVVVLLWSAYEMYPPKGRSLLEQFEREAENTQDPVFRSILEQARTLEAQGGASFENLLTAAGTNSLERYFPRVEIPAGGETNRVILNRLQRNSLGKIRLGLDLQGGMSFMVQMRTNELKEPGSRDRALDQAVEILRKRVDRFGVAEPTIQKAGVDRIEIQMPGLTQAQIDDVKATIERAAFLKFCIVHPESDRLLQEGLVPPGYEVLHETRTDRRTGQVSVTPLLVRRNAERGLTGHYVTRADPVPDPLTGEPKIEFELNTEGARIFADITREYSPRPGGPGGTQYFYLAIVLDGELYSAPRILGEIPGGRGVITGNFDIKEAYELANVLMNPLEAPVDIIQYNLVAATLGADSIESGIRATLIAAILVVGFMLVYYLFAGAVANIALMLNIFILFGVMCGIEATMTLPGIAAVVLTAGMAVDANVLIFERIREERMAGKSLKGSLSAGYDKAFWTIFDTNLTTLIAALIMIWMGTGPVKGFGVTLTIGICVSMFTALVVTRLIFDFCLQKGWLTKLKMMTVIGETRIDFLRFAKPAFVLSWALILVGVGYGFYRGKAVMGVDFIGGDAITYSYRQAVPTAAVRAALTQAGVTEAQILPKSSPAGGLDTIQIVVPFEQGDLVMQTLPGAFPEAGLTLEDVDRKGPAVGREILLSALKSVLLALFGILLYVAFRYEFSFSVAAVVAVIHDVLMTMGWFFLTDRQLSAPMVAAVLTIIGFSINDTIVIFDRIREDLRLGIRGSFRDLMNLALNQTLRRTLITSGTTLLATAALYLFGGGVINDFAFTFLVGIITGTYSTIFIAGTIVLWWHKGQRPVIGPVQSSTGPQVQQPARA